MARIRTIKPEFPQSESMGRVSRDARLLFVQLWTICDDSGKTRAASRMLASLLFPYDDDAPKLIDGWLEELDREGCLVRYRADNHVYIQICNWLNHQKIDKPSASRFPDFDESSRILANPRERSSEDLGSRTKDLGEDQGPICPSNDGQVPTNGEHVMADNGMRICPTAKIVELYHRMLPQLPRVEKLTEKRRKQIHQRWREDLPELENWEFYFDFVKQSDFLMGRSPPTPGRSIFRADIEFLTNATNYAKIAEEKYHR